jgi:hypothetical protein
LINILKIAYDGLKELFSKDNNKSTLLDGELIRHKHGHVVFLVFDIVAVNNVIVHTRYDMLFFC